MTWKVWNPWVCWELNWASVCCSSPGIAASSLHTELQRPLLGFDSIYAFLELSCVDVHRDKGRGGENQVLEVFWWDFTSSRLFYDRYKSTGCSTSCMPCQLPGGKAGVKIQHYEQLLLPFLSTSDWQIKIREMKLYLL